MNESIELKITSNTKSKDKIETATPKLESPKSNCRICCKIFFCGNYKERWKTIYQRKEQAIKSLDGIRALACLWIYNLHSANTINHDFSICLGNTYWPLTLFITTGDYGVDAFFVISGFLITYIVMR